jgi:hypothetical protein
VIELLKKLLGLFQAVARLWADRQLLGSGRAEQREADMKEVMEREEKAELAVSTPDPARDERLRNRFDRSRRQ